MKISPAHALVMRCLPDGSRWKSQAQIIGLSELGGVCADTVLAELLTAGYCESRQLPILCGDDRACVGRVTMYRTADIRRRAFYKQWELQNTDP
jgi:hypothetical protein